MIEDLRSKIRTQEGAKSKDLVGRNSFSIKKVKVDKIASNDWESWWQELQ